MQGRNTSRCIISGSLQNGNLWELAWSFGDEQKRDQDETKLFFDLKKLENIFGEKLQQASIEKKLSFEAKLSMKDVTNNEISIGEKEITAIFVVNRWAFEYRRDGDKIKISNDPQRDLLSQLFQDAIRIFSSQTKIDVTAIDSDWYQIQHKSLSCKFCIMFRSYDGDYLLCSRDGMQLFVFTHVASGFDHDTGRGIPEMIKALKMLSSLAWNATVTSDFYLDPRMFATVLYECFDTGVLFDHNFRDIFSTALSLLRDKLDSNKTIRGKFGAPHTKDLLEAFRENKIMKDRLMEWLTEWAKMDEKALLDAYRAMLGIVVKKPSPFPYY